MKYLLFVLVLAGCSVPLLATPSPSAAPIVVSQPGMRCTSRNGLPDPVCSPGVVDPAVTQDVIDQTICVSGYSASVRPPVSYTNRLKLDQMAQYGFTGSPRDFEEDHVISLELGGDPRDPKNLWPQPGASPNPKDAVEDAAHRSVCAHRMTLAHAQAMIAADWHQLGRELGVRGQ